MKKSIILVATVAALAGCTSHDNQKSAKAQQPTSQQPVASAPSAGQAYPTSGGYTPSVPTYGSSSESALSGTQSGSSADSSFSQGSDQLNQGTDFGAPVESSNRSSDQASQNADLGGLDQSHAGQDTGAKQGSSTSSTEAQRGVVLTEKGVKSLDGSASAAGSSASTAPSMNGSATTDSSRSTQLPGAAGSVDAAAPKSGDEDLSQIPATDGDPMASETSQGKSDQADHANEGLQTNIGDEATLGETDSDRALVQRIRQEVVNDETISSGARSVQIQSVNNQVILKGTVDSEREKAQIGSTAFRASGGKQVLNQLDVTNK